MPPPYLTGIRLTEEDMTRQEATQDRISAMVERMRNVHLRHLSASMDEQLEAAGRRISQSIFQPALVAERIVDDGIITTDHWKDWASLCGGELVPATAARSLWEHLEDDWELAA